MQIFSRFACFTVGALLPWSAHAIEVAMQAGGTVTAVRSVSGGAPPTGISTSDLVFMQWSYDSATTGAPVAPGTFQYTNPNGLNFQFSIQIDTAIFSGSGSWAYVGNTSGLDYFSFEARDAFGAVYTSFPAASNSSNQVAFNIADHLAPFAFLTSTALPAGEGDVDLSSINNGTYTNGFISSRNNNTSGWDIEWSINPASVAFVDLTPATPVLRIVNHLGNTLQLAVDNLPEGQDFHLRSSINAQTFSPLSPPVDFTSATAQPFAVSIDPGTDPLLLFQVFAGPSP